MRLFLVVLALTSATAVGAQPRSAESGLELKLFLEKEVGVEHRVLSFEALEDAEWGPVRRTISYKARIEFPVGLSPRARSVLGHEDISVVDGNLDEPSSRRIEIELRRKAMFLNTAVGWFVQVGPIRYPLRFDR